MQNQEKHFYNDQQHETSELNQSENNEQECSFTAQITKTNKLPEISNEELSNFLLTL